MKITKYLVIIALIFPYNAMACSFNTDCEIGSKCVKPNGGLDGYCVGGLSPGNDNDRQPTRDSMDTTGKKGNTCSFDTDCGVGGQCVKGSGIDGTCM